MRWSDGRALPGNRWDLLEGIVPSTAPRVSVIVAHYRQPEQLARTLRALERQDHPADRLEVIVADDGSPDAPVVPDYVRVVRQRDHGFRLAAVRNLGAAAASGDVLVFLDADTTPEPSFVRNLARLPALAPDCVTVGRRRHARLTGLPATSSIESAAPARALPDPSWLVDAYRDSGDLLDADDRSYRFVIGAVLACSRALFDEVGGFNETFTSYGGEDWEWAYRAWIHGGVLAHVPSAVAWHDGPDAPGRAIDSFAKNAEAIRLADLIPVPGSGSRGLRHEKVDIAVTGRVRPATDGQMFVSIDSLLAVLSRAEWVPMLNDPDAADRDRLDRVRLRVEILRPIRIAGTDIVDELARMRGGDIGELLIADRSGTPCLRVVSTRARRRSERWGRDDLFRRETVRCRDVEQLIGEVDVEGYLGGWL